MPSPRMPVRLGNGPPTPTLDSRFHGNDVLPAGDVLTRSGQKADRNVCPTLPVRHSDLLPNLSVILQKQLDLTARLR